ncbi:component of IIS longevity pathway SMK-1-domain-containing protein [Protomyces lactucae-debilis]|uniref:Component of IIS longevity pathway SMK-1-domain-containing protein n=1 Tax=Protomyces lactucae-debilis TaxID=2754530 RepID=A0A1Y2FIW1_PROLT|nr:component of IIS longevity pathway SMK-1-domain-containing protein [Protomyces lactucae-debilis]ORY83878.1 component of IIS longevity pathway SMK-1-domain-containing protein [Protomyces lactucae-debilis]
MDPTVDGDIGHAETTTLPDAELLDSPASLLLDSHDVDVDLSQVSDTKEPRRVKVYEMKGDAWRDRGTGFCMGLIREVTYAGDIQEEGDSPAETQIAENETAPTDAPQSPPSPAPPPRQQAYFLVKSEELKDTILLESKILKEDLYQIQQNTLIVWQEVDGTDVALSFQEEAGCLEIWNFLRHVQKTLQGQAWEGPVERIQNINPDDLSDDEGESALDPIHLPDPSLAKLPEIEELVYAALGSIVRRENLAKFILGEDYVAKLVTLLEVAEDLESLRDLHRLCNVVKSFILLNDAAIFESILRDEVFLQIAGILEYDPDFPNHKAEHRKYLSDTSKFKEVVPVNDPEIKRKIHQTFRLQYIKDVILARILDDPTFSILNTLIFFNQVDIVQHFQHNEEFLAALFGLFDDPKSDQAARRDDAVLFIQQFCSIAKTLQPPARTALYQAFAQNGLLKVIVYSLSTQARRHICLAGADILMATIDHDPKLVRSYILEQHGQGETTLAETLIQLLISEQDLGIKAQMMEAVRLLTDPSAGPPTDAAGQPHKPDMVLRRREDPETEKFLEVFYERHVQQLMSPLLEAGFGQVDTLPFETSQLYIHLCDLLCFFIRAHTFHSKFWILSTNISCSISQIFATREKHLKLAALRYFRICIGANDEFYNRHLIKNRLLDPLVTLLLTEGSRSNLLNSAALEFFELIRKEGMRGLIYNITEHFREEIERCPHAETLKGILVKWEQFEAPPPPRPRLPTPEGKRESLGDKWQQDAQEAAYFDGDDEARAMRSTNIAAGVKRPLVSEEYDADEQEAEAGKENEPEVSPQKRHSAGLPGELQDQEELSITEAIESKLAQRQSKAAAAAADDTVMDGVVAQSTSPAPSPDGPGSMTRARRAGSLGGQNASPDRKSKETTPGKKRLMSFTFGRKRAMKQQSQPQQPQQPAEEKSSSKG